MQQIIAGTIRVRQEASTEEVWGMGAQRFAEVREPRTFYGTPIRKAGLPNILLGVMVPVEGGWQIDHTGEVHSYDIALQLITSRATFVAPW